MVDRSNELDLLRLKLLKKVQIERVKENQKSILIRPNEFEDFCELIQGHRDYLFQFFELSSLRRKMELAEKALRSKGTAFYRNQLALKHLGLIDTKLHRRPKVNQRVLALNYHSLMNDDPPWLFSENCYFAADLACEGFKQTGKYLVGIKKGATFSNKEALRIIKILYGFKKIGSAERAVNRALVYLQSTIRQSEKRQRALAEKS